MMVRKLAAALLSAGILVPGLANALGLGEIKLNSALNEPLDAEIQLVQVRELTGVEILPALAPARDFEQAGIERYHYLTDMRFEVVVNSTGRSYIKVTSRRPLREPFVNFLIEVHWPAGRLMREYTMLLDPPMYSATPAASTQAPSASVRPAPAPAAQRPAATRAPAGPGASPRVLAAGSGAGGQYGPTNSADSLWNIARELRPASDVTIQQTMVAIQQLNPDAFINGNINLLKRNQVIQGPSADQARQITHRDAMQTVAEHNRAWRERTPIRQAESSPASAPQIDTSGRTADPLEAQVREEEGQLRLVTDRTESATGSSAGGGVEGAPGGDGTQSAEQLEQYRLENQDLKVKLADLSEQAETTERVLSLKDDQIAALQARMADLEARLQQAADGQSVTMPEPMAEPDMLTADAETGADATADDMAGAEPQPESSAAEEPVDYNFEEPATSEPDATFASESDAEPVPASDAQPIVVEEVEQQVVVDAPEQAEKPVKEEDLMSQILNNPLYMALAGGGLILIVLLLLLAARRRREEEDDEFTDDLPDDMAIEAPAALHDEEEETFEEEPFSATEEDAEEAVQQTADVIGEAEIYVAYGRFSQAIEMLESAVANEPGRADIHFKLLEVAVEAEQPDVFNKHYAALKALNDDTYDARADALRDKIGDADSGEFSVADDLADFDLDEDQDELPDTPQRAEEEDEFTPRSVETEHRSSEVAGLDFNLDMSFDEEHRADQGVAQDDDGDATLIAPPKDEHSIDFAADSTAEPKPEPEQDEHVLEFDAGLVSDEEIAPVDEAAQDFTVEDTEAGAESDLDFQLDLDAFEGDEAGEQTVAFDQPVEEPASEPSEDLIESDRAAELASELDFESDFELDTTETLEPETDEATPLDLDAGIDIEDSAEVAPDALDGSALDDAALPETPEEGLASDLSQAAAFAPAGGRAANEDDELDFLTDADETSTKLDLARAYIDMGDREGAKDILDEVLVEGNNEQQQEAKDLLAKLG